MMHDGRDRVKPIRVVLRNFYVFITQTLHPAPAPSVLTCVNAQRNANQPVPAAGRWCR
jgi:hypothetical protein